jgi:hypothetical protein
MQFASGTRVGKNVWPIRNKRSGGTEGISKFFDAGTMYWKCNGIRKHGRQVGSGMR